jgi:hypothetical protein
MNRLLAREVNGPAATIPAFDAEGEQLDEAHLLGYRQARL